MPTASPAGLPLAIALAEALIAGDLKPGEMRATLYCWRCGFVAPRYLDAAVKRRLAALLKVHDEYLRQCFVRLHRRGIMRRQRDEDGFWCYALNPDYRAPEEVPCP